MRASIFTVPAADIVATFTVYRPPLVNLPLINVNSVSLFGPGTGTANIDIDQTLDPGYIGSTARSSGWAGAALITNIVGNILTISTASFGAANSIPIIIDAYSPPNPLPAGSSTVVVNTPAGTVINLGDGITGTGLQAGTTIFSFAQIAMNRFQLELSLPTVAALNDGAALTRTAGQGIVIFPIDQYVAPVEVSIQTLNDGSNVTVQATAVPYSELESPDIWGPYADDAGALTLGTAGTINTYSNKIATAIRFVNSGPAVRVALAQAGIIS